MSRRNVRCTISFITLYIPAVPAPGGEMAYFFFMCFPCQAWASLVQHETNIFVCLRYDTQKWTRHMSKKSLNANVKLLQEAIFFKKAGVYFDSKKVRLIECACSAIMP